MINRAITRIEMAVVIEMAVLEMAVVIEITETGSISVKGIVLE